MFLSSLLSQLRNRSPFHRTCGGFFLNSGQFAPEIRRLSETGDDRKHSLLPKNNNALRFAEFTCTEGAGFSG
jgi:hypothetical protein